MVPNRQMSAKLTLFAVALLPLCAFAQKAKTEAKQQHQLKEIIVTAERRQENIQKTPVAVTAFSSSEILARGIASTSDIGMNTPGLTTVPSTGTISEGDYTLRGIGQDSLSITFDPGVGLYVDDVYIARTSFSARQLFDLESIEVLRGPQGTLYGRNSAGGAIKLYTEQPDQTPSLDVEEAYGSFDSYQIQAMGNMPLSPIAAVRLTASRSAEEGGYLYDTTLQRRVSTNASDYFHGVLLLTPTDRLSVSLSADSTHLVSDGEYFSNLNDQPFVNSSGLYEAKTGYDKSALNYTQSPLGLVDDATDSGLAAHVSYKLSSDVTLRSITAYRENRVGLDLDLNNTGLALIVGTAGHQFTEELQIVGSAFDHRLNYVSGLFYFHESAWQDWIVGEPLQQQNFQATHTVLATNSASAYSQGTYSLSDSLRLTAGLRYTHDQKTIGINSPLGPTPYSTATLIAEGIPTTLTDNNVSPKVGVEQDLGKNVMAYVSYTKGYQDGGYNGTAGNPKDALPFAPEVVDAYEGGIKSEWFDQRFRANASVFDNQISQAQFAYFAPGTGNLVQGNVASVTIRGIELESNALLRPNWQAFGYLDYTYNNIDSATPDAIKAGLLPGNKIKDTPAWKYQIGTSYSHSLGRVPGVVTFRGTWTWTGSSFNSPTDDPVQKISSHGDLDVRLRYDSEDSRWFVQLEGDNVTNDRFYYARLNVLPTVPAQPNLPRQYFVRAGYRFR